MRPQTAIIALHLSIGLSLAGCGGGSGPADASASGAEPALLILGLPSGPTRAAAVSLRVDAGTEAAIRWTLDRRDGAEPATVGTGSTLDLAVPEGALVVSVHASYAGGRQRSGSAMLEVDRTPPSLRLRGLRIQGVLSAAAVVTVAGAADGDGAADASFTVDMACDGGTSPSSLPIDQGQAIGYDLSISVDGLIHPVRLAEGP